MSVTFRPAKRENVALLVGLNGSSGGGKTWTAMEMATGIMDVLAPGNPFAVIDTEAGRAKHYADQFHFDHGDLRPPFTPLAYADAIMSADEAGYPVIVVDSFSHEHAGEGGILDMQEAEFKRMGSREAVKMTSWILPKGEHRKMVSRLLQVRAHLILCFRAEEKIEMVKVKDEHGKEKTEVRKKVTATGIDGWVPIAEKNLPYELTASLLLLASRPGVPLPIKLQQQHRHLFPPDKPITRESGRQLAIWARGGATGNIREGSSPPSSPVHAPASPGPTTAPDRASMLAAIAEMEDALNLSGKVRRDLWTAHCGTATETNVDVSALADLAADLRTREKVGA